MNTKTNSRKPRLALHWQILIGMAAGIAFGLTAAQMEWSQFTLDYVKPFGKIFVNSLKLIAVPLIIASLIKGVSDLKEISKLSSMGGRTVLLYVMTTVLAVTIGLVIVNVVQPGKSITEETRKSLVDQFTGDEGSKVNMSIKNAKNQQSQGPLQPLIDLVPDNVFSAATSNRNMLQVIFFVVFFGIGLILIPAEKARPVKEFFDGLNEVILKLVDLIMLMAPFGVFALLAALIVESPNTDILYALAWYSACVITGLALLIGGLYPLLVRAFTGRTYGQFLRGISPAQLLASPRAPVLQHCQSPWSALRNTWCREGSR